MYNSIEISKKIVAAGISHIKQQYEKIAELFETNASRIQQSEPIEGTIKSLKSIPPRRPGESPNLKSEYPWLEKCYRKTDDKMKSNAIYIFSVTRFPYSESKVASIFEKISQKPKEEKISLCRRNKTSVGWKNVQRDESVCLYVGSSEDIAQRLKEHLFLCNRGTYAMHLEGWFPKNITITVNIWNFHDFLSGEDSDYLQYIEDILWNHYKPLFGRQGKK